MSISTSPPKASCRRAETGSAGIAPLPCRLSMAKRFVDLPVLGGGFRLRQVPFPHRPRAGCLIGRSDRQRRRIPAGGDRPFLILLRRGAFDIRHTTPFCCSGRLATNSGFPVRVEAQAIRRASFRRLANIVGKDRFLHRPVAIIDHGTTRSTRRKRPDRRSSLYDCSAIWFGCSPTGILPRALQRRGNRSDQPPPVGPAADVQEVVFAGASTKTILYGPGRTWPKSSPPGFTPSTLCWLITPTPLLPFRRWSISPPNDLFPPLGGNRQRIRFRPCDRDTLRYESPFRFWF